jgi:CRISPR-associated protein Csm1
MNEQEEIRLLTVAALMHDIGKFMQRGFSGTKSKFDHSELSGYFFDKKVTQFSFQESEEFIENLKFLVTHHHEEKLDQVDVITRTKIISEILSEADNVSSGERRDQDSGQFKLLESIFARIQIGDNFSMNLSNRFYNLKPLYFGDGNPVIYPNLNEELKQDKIEGMYKEHWNRFFDEFKQVLTSQSNKLVPDSFYFLLEKYFWCVPSAYFRTVPDISLFEHSKVTAAFASSMYKYLMKEHPEIFAENNGKDIREKIKDREEKRYLLLVIDANGIQKFIYNVSSKKGLLSLKGRSFFVQALSDLINHYILWDKRINLYESNIIYTGGGKSYLLLPITVKESILEIKKEIETYLFERFGGSLSVSFGIKEASANSFYPDNISKTWEEVLVSASEDRQQRLKNFMLVNYDRFFGAEEVGGYFDSEGKGTSRRICDICRKEIGEDEVVKEGDLEICKECNEIINIARDIRESHYAIISQGKLDEGFELNNSIFFKLTNRLKSAEGRNIVLNMENTDLKFSAPESSAKGYMIVGGRKPPEEGIELESLAKFSRGTKKLGILRMDVDNLGQIFKTGLVGKISNSNEQNYLTLSRISQLSSSISMFFKGEINNILLEETDENVSGKTKLRDYIYIIYAGGDDLFAIGSWDKIPEFALKVRNKFSDYTCNNPSLTISAGIHLIGDKYPLSRGAVFAGKAEDLAKSYNLKGHRKNAVSFFGETVSWEDFKIADCVKNILVENIEQSGKKSLLRKLQAIYALYLKQKKSLSKKILLDKDIEDRVKWSRWMWMLAYYIGRGEKDKTTLMRLRDSLLSDILECDGIMLTSERELISYINLPLNWADYLTRENKGGLNG